MFAYKAGFLLYGLYVRILRRPVCGAVQVNDALASEKPVNLKALRRHDRSDRRVLGISRRSKKPRSHAEKRVNLAYKLQAALLPGAYVVAAYNVIFCYFGRVDLIPGNA